MSKLNKVEDDQSILDNLRLQFKALENEEEELKETLAKVEKEW